MENQKTRKITLSSTVSWVFGGLFLLSSIISFTQGKIGTGFFLALAGVVIFPPALEELKKRFNIEFSNIVKIVFALIFFVVAVSMSSEAPAVSTFEPTITPTFTPLTATITPTLEPTATPTLAPLTVTTTPMPEPLNCDSNTREVDGKCAEIVNVTYEELYRNNEKYVGKIVHYTGQVIQIVGGTAAKQQLRVNIGNYVNNKIIYVPDYSGERLLEGDEIELYGLVTGLYSYLSTERIEFTVPSVKSIEIKRK